MNPTPSIVRRAVVPFTALFILVALYLLSRQPTLPDTEAEAIAQRFRFDKLAFPEITGFPHKTIRQVHPSLAHMSGWMSTIGASVALADLDGDGLANDLCTVDPRIDQVIVAPAPGSPQGRYQPFVLTPDSLPHDSTMTPSGCLFGDFNEDGLLDVLVYYWGRSPVLFLRRPVSATGSAGLNPQSFVATELVAACPRWFTCAAIQVDVDGDGHLDLIIGNYGSDGSRIYDTDPSERQHMQHTMSRAFNGGGQHYFLWNKVGTSEASSARYREVDPGLTHEECHGWTLALGAADLDGDGLSELYIANDFGPDRLLHNRSTPGRLEFGILEGERTFTTPRSKVLGRDSFKGMGIDFGDVNGDGLPDMFVSNLSGPFSIFESHYLWLSTGRVDRMREGVAPYYDASEELGVSRSGWGWDSRLADLDNDGTLEAVQALGFLKGTVNRWPEIQELAAANDQLLNNPRFWHELGPGTDLSGSDHNRFYVRASDGRFYDISKRLGLGDPMVTRGIALADVDGDGRLDFAVANQWEPSFLFRNTAPKPGAFLGLHVRLPIASGAADRTTVQPGHPRADRPSRPAIGAAVTVHLPDGRRLVGQVDGGSGHSGKRSHDIHLGLGDIQPATPLKMDIRWRDGDGKVHAQTLRVAPGWHTVWLGPQAPEQEGTNHE